MKKSTILMITLFFSVAAMIIHGCRKDSTQPYSSIIINLKDAPASYDSVNVQVTGVQFHSDGNGWVDVPITDSIYDLLQLQGNNSTFLANAVIPSGIVSQVRLILGTQNSVSINGTSYPLKLSSEDETGLKVNIHQDLVGGNTYDLVIDFDANQSVIDEGNGSYRLKPVLTAVFL